VAEQHGPRVTDPFMKVDFTVSGVSIKVWHNVTKFQVGHFGSKKVVLRNKWQQQDDK